MTQIDSGDQAQQGRVTRRGVLTAGLGAGLAAVALSRSEGLVSAVSSGIDEDRRIMAAAMRVELAARDLYDVALSAGADPAIAGVMREQHESYAQALAGATGESARERSDAVFGALRSAFRTADPTALAAAAYDLESVAVATHTEILGLLSEPASARLIASILITEARHCAVLADAGGGASLDDLLSNSAEPLPLEDL